VPELAAPPDLLLILQDPWTSRWEVRHEEVYGCYLESGELVPLSSGAGRTIGRLELSPNGEWFSYFWRGGDPVWGKEEGFCIRSVLGGEPRCYWLAGYDWSSYRPGAEEWFIRDMRSGQNWLSVPASPTAPEQAPKPHPYLDTLWDLRFSPDGRWAWYSGGGLWVVDLAATNPIPRKVIDKHASDAAWLEGERLVAAVGDDMRKYRLYVVSLSTGEVTDLGRPPGENVILEEPVPDPTSRFVRVKHGLQLAADRVYIGDAIYDLEAGEWTANFPDSDTTKRHNRALWTGDGSTLLLVEKEKKAYFYDPATGIRIGERDLPERGRHNFSPDLRWSMAVTDGTWELVNLDTGEIRSLDFGDRQLVSAHWVRQQ